MLFHLSNSAKFSLLGVSSFPSFSCWWQKRRAAHAEAHADLTPPRSTCADRSSTHERAPTPTLLSFLTLSHPFGPSAPSPLTPHPTDAHQQILLAPFPSLSPILKSPHPTRRSRARPRARLLGAACASLRTGLLALALLLLAHAGARHALEDALDLRGAAREAVLPEVVARVLDELDEGDEEAPLWLVVWWWWSVEGGEEISVSVRSASASQPQHEKQAQAKSSKTNKHTRSARSGPR